MAAVRSVLAHALFAARPDLAAYIEQHILDVIRILTESEPRRLDELTFDGSDASLDAPLREGVELGQELLVYLLGALVLCERGELHARYQFSPQAGTTVKSVAIIFSVTDPKEVK
jgi:hypothetical protein